MIRFAVLSASFSAGSLGEEIRVLWSCTRGAMAHATGITAGAGGSGARLVVFWRAASVLTPLEELVPDALGNVI